MKQPKQLVKDMIGHNEIIDCPRCGGPMVDYGPTYTNTLGQKVQGLKCTKCGYAPNPKDY